VTIVIPTWNRAALVQHAVASVIDQSWPDWELIVVDDGSEDETVAILQGIVDPRVRVIAAGRIANPARLRNLGVAQGSGELVAFLDSDDVWLPHRLELQIDALRRSGAGWCYADYGHIDADGRPIAQSAGRYQAIDGMIAQALLSEETAAYVGTLLVRSTLFESLGGFDESLVMRPDLDLALRLAVAAPAVAVSESVMLVRDHPLRMTKRTGDAHERSALVFEKLLGRESDPVLRALARRRLAAHLLEAGVQRVAQGERGRGLQLAARALAQGARPDRVAWRLARAWLAAQRARRS
jgi:GT2 family glycosyltransferase